MNVVKQILWILLLLLLGCNEQSNPYVVGSEGGESYSDAYIYNLYMDGPAMYYSDAQDEFTAEREFAIKINNNLLKNNNTIIINLIDPIVNKALVFQKIIPRLFAASP